MSVAASGVEAPADWGNLRSPENYLGFVRAAGFASPGGAQLDRPQVYAAPTRLTLNQWALIGEWTVGAAGQRVPVRFRISLEGRPPGEAHGLDVDASGNGMVMEPRLYQLVRQTTPIVDRQLEIEFLEAGVEAFSFTFG